MIFPFITQGWTLQYEMYFYLLISFVIVFPYSWRINLLALILISSIIFGLLIQKDGPVWSEVTSPWLIEFGAGLWLGTSSQYKVLHKRQWGLIMICLSCLVFTLEAFMARSNLLSVSGWGQIAVWGIPAFCLVAGSVVVESHGGVPLSKLGLELGAASYSIYLFHEIIISLYYHSFLIAFPTAYTIACIVTTCAVCILFYRKLEKPVTRRLHRLVGNASWQAVWEPFRAKSS